MTVVLAPGTNCTGMFPVISLNVPMGSMSPELHRPTGALECAWRDTRVLPHFRSVLSPCLPVSF